MLFVQLSYFKTVLNLYLEASTYATMHLNIMHNASSTILPPSADEILTFKAASEATITPTRAVGLMKQRTSQRLACKGDRTIISMLRRKGEPKHSMKTQTRSTRAPIARYCGEPKGRATSPLPLHMGTYCREGEGAHRYTSQESCTAAD